MCNEQVENCSHEHTRMDRARAVENMNREESLLEIGLSSSVAALLMQCSPYIFDSALSKIKSVVGERTFEPNVAGKFVARMCGSVAKVNSEKALKALLPPVLRSLRSALTNDIIDDEQLDDSILFRLLLLSELVTPSKFNIVLFNFLHCFFIRCAALGTVSRHLLTIYRKFCTSLSNYGPKKATH